MRRMFSVALVSFACLLMAGSASANVTVDLQWVDTGNATLTISPGDNPANGVCSGFFAASNGRCMKVIWTIDAGGLYVGSNSVSWAGGAGLSAASAAFFPAFNSIAVGKLSAFGPFPSPNQPAKNIGISSVVGFTGAVPASDPSSTN